MIAEDAQATEAFGRQWSKTLTPKVVVALHGDLGAGKTTFAKGIVSQLTGTPSEQICSPTFTLMQHYEGATPIYHFDLYRLQSAKEFLQSGFTDYFDSEGICLIEWPEKIEPLLPNTALHVYLSHFEDGKRRICVR